jgi:hypothetical protein
MLLNYYLIATSELEKIFANFMPSLSSTSTFIGPPELM